MLKNDDFVKSVNDFLNQIISGKETRFLEKWEYFKEEVKQIAIERSSYLQREAKKGEKGLQTYLNELFKIENSSRGAVEEEIKNLRAKLDFFYQERYRGAIMRARAEKILLGEQPTLEGSR